MTLIIKKPTGAKLVMAKPAGAKLRITPSFTQWTPALISTALWLDAADANTITTVSGAVSQWNDKSGNGRHATQSTAGSRPGYSGGRLTFNGTQFLTCTPGWGNFWEWLFVFKMNVTNVLQVPIRDSESSNSTVIAAYQYASPSFYRVRGSDNTSYIASSSSEFGTSTRIHGFSSRTSNQALAFVDGTQKTSWAVSGSMGTTLYLGINGSFGNSGLNGSICEFILLSSQANDATREKLEGYLAHKWGLTANLPSNHPYKVNPPAP